MNAFGMHRIFNLNLVVVKEVKSLDSDRGKIIPISCNIMNESQSKRPSKVTVSITWYLTYQQLRRINKLALTHSAKSIPHTLLTV